MQNSIGSQLQSQSAKSIANRSTSEVTSNTQLKSTKHTSPSEVAADKLTTDKLTLSQQDTAQLLAKHLLEPNIVKNAMAQYNTNKALDGTVQDEFLKQATLTFTISSYKEEPAEIIEPLIITSKEAHSEVKEILANLGQLDEESQEYLSKSEFYIEGQINELEKLASQSPKMNKSFTFEAMTQEGDSVLITYEMALFGGPDRMSDKLSITVDGDISAEEQKALEALYAEASEFIEANYEMTQQTGSQFTLEKFDLTSFDSSVLTGFDIRTNQMYKTGFYRYQIDNEAQTKTLQTGMNSGGGLNYNFSLTTDLYQNKDTEALAENVKQLKQVLSDTHDTRIGRNGLHDYIIQNYTDLFTNTDEPDYETKRQLADRASIINSANSQLYGLEEELPSTSLRKFNLLGDYQFNLSLLEGTPSKKSHNTNLDMSQETNVDWLHKSKQLTQEKQLDVESEVTSVLPNNIDKRIETKDYHWEQLLTANFNEYDELTNYSIFSDESIMHKITEYDTGLKEEKLTESDFKENIEYLELKVFKDTIKLTKSSQSEEENEVVLRIDNGAPIPISHSKKTSAYLDVQSYKLSDKETSS